MALHQVDDLPPDVDIWWAELATVYDSRLDSPLARLVYKLLDSDELEGRALVVLSSGCHVEVVEYASTELIDAYTFIRFGRNYKSEDVLREIMNDAELSAENIMWTESDDAETRDAARRRLESLPKRRRFDDR